MMSSIAASPQAQQGFDVQLHKAAAIFWRDAQLAVSYEANFLIQWLTLFVNIVVTYFLAGLVPPSPLFGFGGQSGTYFDYLVINLAFVTFQSAALQSFAKVIREGQMQGTLEVVIATPTRLSLIVLAGGLWAFAFTLLQTIVYLIVASFFGLDLRHTNVLAATIFMGLTVASLSPLGVMSAAATMIFKQTGPFDFVMTSLSFMFGGVYLPVSALPHLLQNVGWMLPITHALNGLRGAANGATVTQLLPDALWLCVATAVLLPFSLYFFDRAVHLAKVDGTLGQY